MVNCTCSVRELEEWNDMEIAARLEENNELMAGRRVDRRANRSRQIEAQAEAEVEVQMWTEEEGDKAMEDARARWEEEAARRDELERREAVEARMCGRDGLLELYGRVEDLENRAAQEEDLEDQETQPIPCQEEWLWQVERSNKKIVTRKVKC